MRIRAGAGAQEGIGAMSRKHMGSSIDDFLKEEGIFDEAQAQAAHSDGAVGRVLPQSLLHACPIACRERWHDGCRSECVDCLTACGLRFGGGLLFGPDIAHSRPMHILVVDDTASVLQITDKMLRSAGYAVTCVGSGEEAIKAVTEHKFDLVLMDVVMDKMGGVEA